MRLYEDESPGIRLFVRARHLLAPLEQIAASVPPRGDVLDVGCGHGLFSLLLALAWPDRHILGVDPSPAKIEVARRVGRALPNVEFRLGSVEAAGERSFQAITVLDVLYLLPPEEKLRVLRGCRQVLAPEGVLLVKTNDIHPAWKYALTRLQEWAMTSIGLTLGHGGLFFQPCEANRQLLGQAGFEAQVSHLRHWSPYPHVIFTARPSASPTGEPPVPPGSPTGEPPVPPGSPTGELPVPPGSRTGEPPVPPSFQSVAQAARLLGLPGGTGGSPVRPPDTPGWRAGSGMNEPPSEAPPVRLSVVIAAYNEARVIGESIDRVATYLEGRAGELIVVDDGSVDQTREIVRARQACYPHLRLLESGANHGKGHAIKQGILCSRGQYVFYTDADLVYPIQGIEPFVEALERGAEVAIGSRSHPHTLFALHPRHFSYIYQRYLIGRAYITLVNWWLGLGVSDTQCGFKGFRGEAARTIFARTRLNDFAFDVEALYVARLLGCRVEELPVYFLYLGEQSSVQLVKDSLRMLRDLAIIRRNGRRGLYTTDFGLPILDFGLGSTGAPPENPKSKIQNPKSR